MFWGWFWGSGCLKNIGLFWWIKFTLRIDNKNAVAYHNYGVFPSSGLHF
ncbi:hypothetical protein ACKLNO_09255 [Neisseriaceae bacterium B1]